MSFFKKSVKIDVFNFNSITLVELLEQQ
jgi:hypothetical protein